MQCSTCASELRPGAKFCSECGSATTVACPSCGRDVGAGDKFCAECGHRLAEAPPAPSPDSAPVEERRFVSTLFLDLVGFTPLTETRDSEEVRSMLTTYFERAREVVDRFGGVIDKYIGDALMAVWGAHVAHEDDAERMVRAGLELITAIEALGGELGIDGLTARVGGTSGEAAVGGDGNQGTGLIIGDIVNLASRFEAAAPAGRMLVDETTKNLVAGVQFEPSGPLELKGVTGTREGFLVGPVTAGNQGRTREGGLIPPFVGRADEMRLLKDAFHAVGRERRTRLVTIVGQAGIGKSRVVGELWNYLDGLPETTWWHQGRAPAYGAGVAYWALGEMVRQRCGILETDDDHRTRTRLRTTLAEHITVDDDRAWMEPRLETLLGLGDAPADRAELFAAWRMLFLELGRTGNVVMAFEDLHWADDGTLDFIEELVAVGTDAPILVVAISRPDLLERRSGWGTGTSTITTHLPALNATTMGQLITGVVPEAPGATIASIVDHSGGIPLYAVEMLRMLANRDLIAEQPDGTYRPVGDLGEVEIPDSLQSLVGARLDQLDPDDRALLNDAALLGQSFTLEGMAVLQEADVDALAGRLEPLVKREILAVNRDPRSPERGQYRFVQSIIREIAHQRISRADRLRRHLKVAQYFESLGDPELNGIVASHLLDAFEVASESERETLRSAVVGGLLAAADRAADVQAHDQVLELCERGLEIVTDAASRGRLLIKAARSAHAGLDDRADEFARSALESCREAGDSEGELEAATHFARSLNDRFRSNEAVDVLEHVMPEAVPPSHLGAAAMAQMARSYGLSGEADRGIEWADRALALAEALDDLPVFADALTTKATAYGSYGRIREALMLLDAVQKLGAEHQLTHARRRALNNSSFLSASDTVGDLEPIEQRLADARRLGEPREIADQEIAYAQSLFFHARWDEARQLLAGIDRESLSEDLRWEYDGVVRLFSGAADDPEGADDYARQWIASMDNPDLQTQINISRELCSVAFLNRRFEECFDHAMAFPAVLTLRLDIYWAAWAAMMLGDAERLERVSAMAAEAPERGRHITLMTKTVEGALAALAGRRHEAETAFNEAVDLVEQVWPVLLQAHLFAFVAKFLGTEDPSIAALARRAYDTFASVEATNFLEIFSDGLLPPDAAISQAG